MALPRLIKNYNVFHDGISYFGLSSEAKLPSVKIQTEAHRGSGMDGAVGQDVGMESMSAEVTFSEWSAPILKTLGKVERFVLRPAMTSATDFSASTIIATLSGLITTSEPGDLKPGANAVLKVSMDVQTYKLELNGEVIFDIDLVNAKRVIGGVDQLAEIRRAMGM